MIFKDFKSFTVSLLYKFEYWHMRTQTKILWMFSMFFALSKGIWLKE